MSTIADGAATTPEAPKTLKTAMEGIEEDWKSIEQAFATPTAAAMPAVAIAADKVAAVMKLAHASFEDTEVPGFGAFAREAEAAFHALAGKARGGDLDAVRTMGQTMQSQHCARCHDAYEEVHG